MSYRIEYQWKTFFVPGALLGAAEDRYLVAIEGGDNNMYDMVTDRRSRDWDVCMAGTHSQVLREAVRCAGACEGNMLKPHGRHCTPENYIRRIRRLLAQAATTPRQGSWHARLRAKPDHPAVKALCALGLKPSFGTRFDIEYAVIETPPEHHAFYFGLVDQHMDSFLPAWCWFEVTGLPRS